MPVTIGLVAAGTQALTGLGQTLFSGRKKREREMEDYAKQSPLYQGSKSVDQYYQEALNRYNESPFQSQQYQVGAQNARRAIASGLSAMQDRRSAIGGVGRLAANEANALSNLGVQAEAQRNARFGQLGNATQMKTAEDYKKFDINQMTPFNRMMALKQFKAQAANARQAAGLQTLAGGLGNAASIGMLSQMGTGSNNQMPVNNNPLGIDYTSGVSPTRQKLNLFTGWGQ